jgi:hypothetical protein
MILPNGPAVTACRDLAPADCCRRNPGRRQQTAVAASGEAFAALADMDVRQVMTRGMLHGFLNLPAVIKPVRRCLDRICLSSTRERSMTSSP